MPMQRELYPPDWDAIAHAKKQSAGWKCEECGKQCRKPVEAFRGHKYTLTVAHLDHNPANCSPDNLKALCAPCHLRYDAMHHAETRRRKRSDSTSQAIAALARLIIADEMDNETGEVKE